MKRTKYKLNQKQSHWDTFWMVALVVSLVLIALFGYKLIAYISTNNILKGEF